MYSVTLYLARWPDIVKLMKILRDCEGLALPLALRCVRTRTKVSSS